MDHITTRMGERSVAVRSAYAFGDWPPTPWTSHGCPTDCDRTYLGSGHAGGWSSDHDGACPHGVYVGGCGADWMCGYCENGID